MSDVRLAVGCPVYKRGWILRPWALCVEQACGLAGVEPQYRFVFDPKADPEAEAYVARAMEGRRYKVVHVEDGELPNRNRDGSGYWDDARHRHMVDVRNALLGSVREGGFTHFLSVDSDILLHEQAVANLLESSGRFDAVGGRCYMFPVGREYPSYGMLLNVSHLHRPDTDQVIPVHIIMAIKLMNEAAFNVDYDYHFLGEDIGWSANCAKAGLKVGWDGRVVSKHVQNPKMLEEVDPRCGY